MDREIHRQRSKAAPSGNQTIKVDAQGRLTIPAEWVHYFRSACQDNQVYITSTDLKLIKVYPKSVWDLAVDEAEGKLTPVQFDAWNQVTQRWGITSAIDEAGRVTIAKDLREAMKLNGNPVVLFNRKGVLNIYTKEEYDRMYPAAAEQVESLQETLAALGLL